MRARGLLLVVLLGASTLFPAVLDVAQARPVPGARVMSASLETWHSFQPAGWVTSRPVTCSVRVTHSQALLPLAQYRISTTGGASWSDPWQDCSPGPIITDTLAILTATNVAFPHSTTANQNYIQFRIVDGLGIQLVSDPYVVQVDTEAPSSAIQTSGCYNTDWTGQITGTANDSGSGVQVVEILIRRSSDSHYYDGLSWQAAALWLQASGTTSWSYAFAAEAQTYSVQSRARDSAGLWQVAYVESTFSHDGVAPESSPLTTGSYNAQRWPGLITGTASDLGSGVASVQVRLQRASDGQYFNGVSWAAGEAWIAASGSTPWSLPFVPVAEGQYHVASRATDSCGNASTASAVVSFVYDNTAPAAPTQLTFAPQGWSAINSFDVNWTNPADLSGMASVHFKWDVAPTGAGDQSSGSPVAGASIHSLSGLHVPSQGSHQLYVWLEDAAGNVDHRTAVSLGPLLWDGLPPNSTLVSLTGTHGCGVWYTGTVQANLSVMDATSGISMTYWRLDGGAWQPVAASVFQASTEGSHVTEYYSVDLAGNTEPVRTVSPAIKIDFTPPTTAQPRYTGTLSPSGWYTSSVAVALTALDATSGVSATYYQLDGAPFVKSGTFDVSLDGIHDIRYYSADAACNVEATQTATVPLKIDRTPPTTVHQLAGKAGQPGWFVGSPVTVTLSASDAVAGVAGFSGLDRVRYRIDGGSWQQSTASTVTFTVSPPSGQNEYVRLVEYYAMDVAGNAESAHVLSVGIDFSAPGPILHVPSVLPSGWTNINCFDIAWDPTDNPTDVSGIAGVYYSFSVPTSATDGTYVASDSITALTCVAVPAELGDGARNIYLWLKDKAGNSDHRSRVTVSVRLDRTPPEVVSLVNGSLCNVAGWYNSVVTVTFAATDLPSGMVGGVISYRVAGGDSWIPGNAYYQGIDGRYVVEGRATDTAGNVSSVVTATFKVDRTAPQAPIAPRVEPATWSAQNCFTVTWLNPTDLAGVGGAYYKRTAPPTSPTDGIHVDGASTSLACVSADAEGEVPLYVWLVDKACNVDQQRRSMVLLKYDRTPPTTNHTPAGMMGGDGWYTSTVQVALTSSDEGSGWATSYYRVGGDSWKSGASFDIATQGVVTFSYYSVDVAGNAEAPRAGSIKLDGVAPSSRVSADSYSATSSFTVSWDGSDGGSGLRSFDIQYRIGTNGVWQDWLTNVDPLQRSHLFPFGAMGKAFYYRCRARDRAGNVEAYPTTPDAYVSVDPLTNGDFARDLSTGWERSWDGQAGGCVPSRTAVDSYSGASTWAAVLGCPREMEVAPLGTAMICQTLNVPAAQDISRPALYFRYHMFTYDVLWGPTTRVYYDSFNVAIWPQGSISPTLVFTDGNRTDAYGERLDLGWREGSVDLQQYAGQSVRICFATVSREDPTLNTWAFVDDVRMVNLERRLYLPMIRVAGPASGLSSQVHQSSAPTDRRYRR